MSVNAKYKEWLTEDGLLRIESWASDGLTNEDIAHNMGITRQTLNNWCKKYSSIFDALKKGREPVVRKLENSLIKKAQGFEYVETTTEMWVGDDGEKRKKVSKHTRYSSPDTSALIFLLKNYKPNKYRNYNDLTKKQIEAELRKTETEIRFAQSKLEALQNSGDNPTGFDDDGFLAALESEGEELWPEE